MEKVYLQFATKRDFLLFTQYIGSSLCIVQLEKLIAICELSEEQLETVTKKYKARQITK